jgi:hypothetical protein
MTLDVAPSGAHHFYAYGCYKDLAPTEPVLGSTKNRVEKNRLTFFTESGSEEPIFIDLAPTEPLG